MRVIAEKTEFIWFRWSFNEVLAALGWRGGAA
jgi:hypothetical protein